MTDVTVLLMQSRIVFRGVLKTFLGKMVTSAITVAAAAEVRRQEEKEEKEESILAMLGIMGTVLNLFVIVFVYIYTTL
ncbi:protein TUNAR-like [Pelodytes ibericus]